MHSHVHWSVTPAKYNCLPSHAFFSIFFTNEDTCCPVFVFVGALHQLPFYRVYVDTYMCVYVYAE